jgi:hypothetical protein
MSDEIIEPLSTQNGLEKNIRGRETGFSGEKEFEAKSTQINNIFLSIG